MDRVVLLDVPDGSLVFDGASYVNPADAKWVSLAITNTADVLLPDTDYPVQYDPLQVTPHHWENHWVCKVISVDTQSSAVSAADVVYIADINNGKCVCGVTCLGTAIQNVPVYVIQS